MLHSAGSTQSLSIGWYASEYRSEDTLNLTTLKPKISQANPALFYIQLASNTLFPFQKFALHKNKHSQVDFSQCSGKLGTHEKAYSTF